MSQSVENVASKENYFSELAKAFLLRLTADEHVSLNLSAEASLFIRFNKSKVRQSTEVDQASVTLNFIINDREIKKEVSLLWNKDNDLNSFVQALEDARGESEVLPASQFIVFPENQGSSSENHEGDHLHPSEIIERVLSPVKDVDFAGLLVSGLVIHANFNSKGQSHWFSTESFYVDYSLYSKKQKAVKSCYAGHRWNQAAYEQNVKLAIEQLRQLELPVQKVAKGKYRTYFAPAAVDEILGTMQLDAFSGAAYKQGHCALKALYDGEKLLSEQVTLIEDFSLGFTPRFNEKGEVAENRLPLIENGRGKNFLVSSRTAKEYGLKGNAANGWEHPRSLALMPGSLSRSEILDTLGTGLFVSNLHYLNWSDQPNARITGMTRYACFWVEEGVVKGPIEDLRFDETLYQAFGENLIAITNFAEAQPSISTYYSRSIGGRSVPGLLVRDFSYTL